MEVLRLALSTGLSVVALFVITKLMGHKQIAQLDFFDYVNGITIGSIGAEMATELEEPWKPFLAMVIYMSASLILNFIAEKVARSRRFINGAPTILMCGGKIYRDNLKKAKLDLSEFMLMCRECGYFDLEEIEVAIFEHNGRISILPSSENRPCTPSDLGLTPKKSHIGTEVIMDGVILTENLKRMGKDREWLLKLLAKRGHKSPKEIFLAIFRKEEDRLTLYPYE